MAAATVCLMTTGCVPAMCAAILITGGDRTFARSVSAFFVRFCVVHFFSIVLARTAAILGVVLDACPCYPNPTCREASEDYYGEDGESRFERALARSG